MTLKPDKTADVRPAKDEKDPDVLSDEEVDELVDVTDQLRSPTVQKTGDVKEKRD